jgi:phosphoglycolate phosphatase-like HAD superfamily hydrolase
MESTADICKSISSTATTSEGICEQNEQGRGIYETLLAIMPRARKHIRVDAVLWDFDGTLADSAAKNIAITKQVLARVAPHLTGEKLPLPLQSKAHYHHAIHGANHWRDLYREFFDMSTDEIDAAGPLWQTYQMNDKTGVPLFDGIAEAVAELSHLPQGICSANASQNIRQVLDQQGLGSAFQSVIGYETLPDHQQKPAPDGGLQCLQEIFGQTSGKTIVYVGDHVADAIFARGLDERLGQNNTVISVAVTYSGSQPANWSVQPDEVIDSPAELTAWLIE